MELDLQRIPQVFLAQMKQEAGVNDRDVQSLTFEEKVRHTTAGRSCTNSSIFAESVKRGVQEDDGGLQWNSS